MESYMLSEIVLFYYINISHIVHFAWSRIPRRNNDLIGIEACLHYSELPQPAKLPMYSE